MRFSSLSLSILADSLNTMSLVINVNDTDHFDFLSATSQADLPETVTHLEVDVVGLKHGLLYKRRGVHG